MYNVVRATTEELQSFYFEAMLAGYAGDAKPPEDGQGFKSFGHIRGSLALSDRWNDKGGSIIINEAINRQVCTRWAMFYRGVYDKDVIPFLKAVLASTYREGVWVGGRGHGSYEEPDKPLLYINSQSGDFEFFSGREQIISTAAGSDPEMGWHDYHGGLVY